MKNLFLALCTLGFAPNEFAETWQCTDAGHGHGQGKMRALANGK